MEVPACNGPVSSGKKAVQPGNSNQPDLGWLGPQSAPPMAAGEGGTTVGAIPVGAALPSGGNCGIASVQVEDLQPRVGSGEQVSPTAGQDCVSNPLGVPAAHDSGPESTLKGSTERADDRLAAAKGPDQLGAMETREGAVKVPEALPSTVTVDLGQIGGLGQAPGGATKLNLPPLRRVPGEGEAKDTLVWEAFHKGIWQPVGMTPWAELTSALPPPPFLQSVCPCLEVPTAL